MSEQAESSGVMFWGDANDAEALQRYQTLVNTIGDGVLQLDAESRFVAVNDSILELSGYARGDLFGKHISMLFDDEDSATIKREIDRLRSHPTEQSEVLNLAVQTAKGEQVRCEVRVSLLEGDDTMRGTVGTVRDITEQRRREQELRETREQLEGATRGTSVGIWMWDIQENVVTADEYLAESYGLDPEKAVGAPMEAFYEPIHEDDEDETWEQLNRAVEQTGELEAEYRVRDADGELMWVEARGEVEYDDGEPIRMHGAISDITERKRREQLLVAQKELLERIASGAPVEECLSALCNAVTRLNPGVRASILLADDDRESFEQSIAPDHSESWSEGLEGAPINDLMIGTCGTAVFRGDSITCEDIANDDRWSKEWRDVCIDNGVQAGHSEPILDADGDPEGSFMLCFDEPRGPNEWEQRLIEFGTHIASVALERERSRQALRESEERYRNLFESIDEGFCILEKTETEPDEPSDYRYLEANPAFETHTDLHSVVGKTLHGVLPDEAPKWCNIYDTVLETGEPTRFEQTLETEGRILELYAFPLENEERQVGVIFQDITEQKEQERQLRDAKSRLEAATEAGAVGTWEWHISDDTLVVGPSFARKFGIDPDAAADGVPLERFVSAIHEGDRDRVEREIEEAIQSGDEYEAEYRVWNADDKLRWVVARGHVEYGEDGNPVMFPGALTDITQRKENQRKIERSERRYRTLAENFPNGAVAVYDHDLRFTLAQGAVLDDTLPSRDQIEGRTVPEVYPQHIVDDLEPQLQAAVEDGETSSATFEFGSRNWQVWATPLRDDDGEIFAGLSFAQDVTEQVEREQQLEELVERLETSNERLEQFAYAASHDLQEPLRMVSSYLQMIEQRYGDELDEDGEEFLEFAVDGADRMRDMIEGLLEYSRVETRGDSFEPVELNNVLKDVREDLQMRIEESGTEIATDSLPQVEGDEGQLRQVFQNLLDNAIEYSGDEPPRVDITADREGDEWVLSVSDEGIGIDAADADRVFEVFESLHSPNDYSGTGIGLALCERIIERHGGDIWVDSEPGEGAAFSFTLPVEGTHRDS